MDAQDVLPVVSVGVAAALVDPRGAVHDMDEPVALVQAFHVAEVAAVDGAAEECGVGDGECAGRGCGCEEVEVPGVVGDDEYCAAEVVEGLEGDALRVGRDGEAEGVDAFVADRGSSRVGFLMGSQDGLVDLEGVGGAAEALSEGDGLGTVGKEEGEAAEEEEDVHGETKR